jgi:hypothetical protein
MNVCQKVVTSYNRMTDELVREFGKAVFENAMIVQEPVLCRFQILNSINHRTSAEAYMFLLRHQCHHQRLPKLNILEI